MLPGAGLPGLGGIGPGIPGGPLPGLALPGLPGLNAGALPGLGNIAGLRPIGGLAGIPAIKPVGIPLTPGGLGLGKAAPAGGAAPLIPGQLPKTGTPMVPGVLGKSAAAPLNMSTSKAGPLSLPGNTGLNNILAAANAAKAGAVAKGGGITASLAPLAALNELNSVTCTVYIGRISTEVSDEFVKQLLEKCGKVTKWNRAADPNTSKLTSFGFCDFEDAQALWRALRFLHEKQLCDKRLLVKCEDRVKSAMEKWRTGRKEELKKKRADRLKKPEANFTDELLEEELALESKDIADDVDKLLADKNKGFPELKDGTGADEKDEKNADKAFAKDGKGETINLEDDDKENQETPEEREKKAKEKEERERKAKLEREARSRSRAERKRREAACSRNFRPSRREKDRERRVQEREREIDQEYRYRIRDFERGEEKRISNYKRDLEDLKEPPEPTERERRKYADRDCTFGKDSRDEREWKRHREDKASQRQKEKEKDKADRLAEEQEVAEARRKVEEEEKKKEEEEEEEQKRLEEELEAERKRKADEERRRLEEEERKIREELQKKKDEDRLKREAEQRKIQQAAAEKLLQKIELEMSQLTSVDKIPVGQSYTGDDDDKGSKRPDAGGGVEPKLKEDDMRKLIQKVPTEKAKAFAFEIDWQIVQDNNIIEKKLRPWVKKKVTEYLGAEEQGMIEFIMRKVSSRTKPQSILEELEGFLDEEAENFTLKMWRMLIFEVLRVQAR